MFQTALNQIGFLGKCKKLVEKILLNDLSMKLKLTMKIMVDIKQFLVT